MLNRAPDPVSSCAWVESMRTMQRLAEAVQGFGIRLEPRSLQNVLMQLGAGPGHIFISGGGRGRTGHYDPLVCWVLATAKESAWSRASLRDRLADARMRASEAVWREFQGEQDSAHDAIGNEWQWRVESTAYHLFISDPDHGLHPALVSQFLESGLDSLTLDSPTCLRSTLSIYSDAMTQRLQAALHGRNAEDDECRIDAVLTSLNRFGVLTASDRLLGPGPFVAAELDDY